MNAPAALDDLLRRGLTRAPQDPALFFADGAWSWNDLEAFSTKLARGYLAMGLQPGDRLASLLPNRWTLIVHYLACFKAGLVATPLNYRYTPREIDHALEVSGARAMVAHGSREQDITASRARHLELGVVWDEGGSGGRPLEELIHGSPETHEPTGGKPDDPAVIFFTSGSTGPAKGVTHTRESFGWMVTQAAEAHGISETDTLLPASSYSHIAGTVFCLAGFFKSARVAIVERFDHAGVGPMLRRARPTFLLTLPSTLLHLLREKETEPEEFRTVRHTLCGGDKVSPQLAREFEALAGRPICECYGMTEIGFAMFNDGSRKDKISSIGRANPGFAFSVRDENGIGCRDGEEGRVWTQTRSLLRGYWGDEAATREVFRDGWFDTGDVMAKDGDGYFWFRGRRKQIIVHDGSNIAPQEVEAALLEHPAVANAGVIGVRDDLHGENVRAYVELKKESPAPSAGELIAFARERVGYKAPEEIVFLEEMPINAVGKVDRPELKRRAAGDHAHCI
jgi:long-chain acyl-CoA synthetase